MPGRFWEKEIETLKPKELQKLQFRRLQKTLKQAAKSSFYRQLFRKHRLSPGK